jgi:hypothetical protein
MERRRPRLQPRTVPARSTPPAFALPDRRISSVVPQPSAVARNVFCAPDMLLRRAAIRNDRFKPMAILRRGVDDNSCCHNESLNGFARFGNRSNESDH